MNQMDLVITHYVYESEHLPDRSDHLSGKYRHSFSSVWGGDKYGIAHRSSTLRAREEGAMARENFINPHTSN